MWHVINHLFGYTETCLRGRVFRLVREPTSSDRYDILRHDSVLSADTGHTFILPCVLTHYSMRQANPYSLVYSSAHNAYWRITSLSSHIPYWNAFIQNYTPGKKTWISGSVLFNQNNGLFNCCRYNQYHDFNPFCNPLLFASCTDTFSKWCKIIRGMKRSAQ
jgi:hypothetical protein